MYVIQIVNNERSYEHFLFHKVICCYYCEAMLDLLLVMTLSSALNIHSPLLQSYFESCQMQVMPLL